MPTLKGIDEPCLIWTRSSDDRHPDAHLFEPEIWRRILHLPALSTQAIQPLPEFPRRCSAEIVIITSQNAVPFLTSETAQAFLAKHRPKILCIGHKTQKRLQDLGIPSIVPSIESTAQQLAQWLDQHQPSARTLFIGAERPAFDWIAWGKKRSEEFFYLAVYRTLSLLTGPNGRPLPQDVLDRLQTIRGLVCFASPSAVHGFIKAIWVSEQNSPLPLHALCIGPTTATPCHGKFERIETLHSPSLPGLAQRAQEIFAQMQN